MAVCCRRVVAVRHALHVVVPVQVIEGVLRDESSELRTGKPVEPTLTELKALSRSTACMAHHLLVNVVELLGTRPRLTFAKSTCTTTTSMSLSSTFQPRTRNSLMISNLSAEMAWFSPVSFCDFVICGSNG